MRAVNAPTVKRAQQHGFRVRNKMRLFQRRRKVFLWYIGPVYSRPGQNCLINVKERIKIILPLNNFGTSISEEYHMNDVCKKVKKSRVLEESALTLLSF